LQPTCNQLATDTISRQAAQHKINALIDEFETIMKEIRERNVDDSVCGLCEYDGAFMSDSGNWCNECPGFERDDCFKLKDQYREEWAGSIKNLPPVQPTNEMLERCRFEYIHACKIVSIPTPDVTGKDKQDAYAVIKALQPIFGDVPFAKVKRGDSDGTD
jgi:hypothetical protein